MTETDLERTQMQKVLIENYIIKVKPLIEAVLKRGRKKFVYEKTIFGSENPDTNQKFRNSTFCQTNANERR